MTTEGNVFASGDTFTPDMEITTVRTGQPHVVILGSGASKQACPKGDANGRNLPLMSELIETLNLAPILDAHGVSYALDDFEAVYSQLDEQTQFKECCEALDERVRAYFSSLSLPDHPTIYDHLVLSLRPRDVIATFNWDPLLVQAAQRNANHAELPQLLFLHGNVAVGYCDRDKRKGPFPGRCPNCRQSFRATQLLYPVKQKDYPRRPFIWDEWQDLRDAMNRACILTIFGFGAPATDVEAVELMRTAWPSPNVQKAQWVEIINTAPRDELLRQWSPFILSHHADTTADFYESRIARHPRRTGEAWAATHLFGMWEDGHPLPRNVAFPDLWEWFSELIKHETEGTC